MDHIAVRGVVAFAKPKSAIYREIDDVKLLYGTSERVSQLANPVETTRECVYHNHLTQYWGTAREKIQATVMTRTRPRMNLQAVSDLADLADYSFAFAIRAVAAIGIADQLSEGPKHIDELAEQGSCDRHGLIRVLRALATKSVFKESPAETFELGPIGELLQTDHPLSMRWFFRLEPDVQALAGLESSIRTGKPSFNALFGMDYFDWMAVNDVCRDRFRESQRALNRLELLAIPRIFPWQQVHSIVDIGGNDGSLVAALLQRYPGLVGTVFDLPKTAREASNTFENAGLSDRASVVCGDVFDLGVPRDADIYILKRVLVGFSDDQASLALSNIRDAMAPDSRILIIEPMRNSQDRMGFSLDLLMLNLGLGRVRSTDEFSELLTNVGLGIKKSQSVGFNTVIELGIENG